MAMRINKKRKRAAVEDKALPAPREALEQKSARLPITALKPNPADLTKKKVVIVLTRAYLETAKTRKGYELLNCDDHRHLCKKNKLDAATYRPDITHQVLLALLDSPLNKAGCIQVQPSATLLLANTSTENSYSYHEKRPRGGQPCNANSANI
jgi:hypothetical protein